MGGQISVTGKAFLCPSNIFLFILLIHSISPISSPTDLINHTKFLRSPKFSEKFDYFWVFKPQCQHFRVSQSRLLNSTLLRSPTPNCCMATPNPDFRTSPTPGLFLLTRSMITVPTKANKSFISFILNQSNRSNSPRQIALSKSRES